MTSPCGLSRDYLVTHCVRPTAVLGRFGCNPSRRLCFTCGPEGAPGDARVVDDEPSTVAMGDGGKHLPNGQRGGPLASPPLLGRLHLGVVDAVLHDTPPATREARDPAGNAIAACGRSGPSSARVTSQGRASLATSPAR